MRLVLHSMSFGRDFARRLETRPFKRDYFEMSMRSCLVKYLINFVSVEFFSYKFQFRTSPKG